MLGRKLFDRSGPSSRSANFWASVQGLGLEFERVENDVGWAKSAVATCQSVVVPAPASRAPLCSLFLFFLFNTLLPVIITPRTPARYMHSLDSLDFSWIFHADTKHRSPQTSSHLLLRLFSLFRARGWSMPAELTRAADSLCLQTLVRGCTNGKNNHLPSCEEG